MPCQLEPLMKKLEDSVMKAILADTLRTFDTKGNETNSLPRKPRQLPWTYDIETSELIRCRDLELQRDTARENYSRSQLPVDCRYWDYILHNQHHYRTQQNVSITLYHECFTTESYRVTLK